MHSIFLKFLFKIKYLRSLGGSRMSNYFICKYFTLNNLWFLLDTFEHFRFRFHKIAKSVTFTNKRTNGEDNFDVRLQPITSHKLLRRNDLFVATHAAIFSFTRGSNSKKLEEEVSSKGFIKLLKPIKVNPRW